MAPLDQAEATQPQQRLGATPGDGSDPLGPARGQHHTHGSNCGREGSSATSATRGFPLRVSVSTASRSPSISLSQVAPWHDHTRRGGTRSGATLDGRPGDGESPAPSAGAARASGGRVTLLDGAPGDGAASAGRMGDLDTAGLAPR